MNFQYLSYAVSVKKYGSFSKAAKELFISQPALSNSIKKLEEEIGFSLFNRTPNGIVVTEKGKDFFYKAEPVIEQYVEIEDFYREKITTTASISISAFDSNIFSYAFTKALKHENTADYNNIFFYETSLENICQNIEEEKSSLGLIFFPSLISKNITQFLQYTNLEYYTIFEDYIYTLTSQSNPYLPKHREDTFWLNQCIHIPNHEHIYLNKICSLLNPEDVFKNVSFKTHIHINTLYTKYQMLSLLPNSVTFSCHTIPELREKFHLTEFPCPVLGKMEFGYICKKEHKLSSFENQLIDEIISLLEK